MIVNLRIPIEAAVNWNIDALNVGFELAAEGLGGRLVHDSEADDMTEWFQFVDLTAEQVKTMVERELGRLMYSARPFTEVEIVTSSLVFVRV